jgi:hypothetical protein
VLDRQGRPRREHEAQRVGQRPEDDRLAVADLLGHRAEERLAEAPGEVLDRNGEGELGAGPVELHGDGKLEDAEGGADG